MPPETTSVPRSSAGGERRPPVSIVIPVFNESAALGRLNVRLGRVRQDLDRSAEVIYVDDGSTDRSLEELRVIQARDSGVTVVALARNAGQHAAVLAGFAHARGEVVITLDAARRPYRSLPPAHDLRSHQPAGIPGRGRTHDGLRFHVAGVSAPGGRRDS